MDVLVGCHVCQDGQRRLQGVREIAEGLARAVQPLRQQREQPIHFPDQRKNFDRDRFAQLSDLPVLKAPHVGMHPP